jgi:hypothetical protein
MAADIRGDQPITALTAILVCIRNENPSQVIRNLHPLLNGLRTANGSMQSRGGACKFLNAKLRGFGKETALWGSWFGG